MTKDVQGMQSLNDARAEINDVDRSIIKLLAKRFELAHQINQIKEANSLPILDSSREKQVLDRVGKYDDDPDTREFMKDIYKEIMKNSRKYQDMLRKND